MRIKIGDDMMRNLLWNIIEKSKEGTNFNSKKQYINLTNILKNYTDEDNIKLRDEWWTLEKAMTNNEEYEKLHLSNGGIVNGGDDTFCMDFGGWVIAQGKELYDNFMKNGSTVIIEYINKNHVSEDDYTYECMSYVFINDDIEV